MTLTKSEYILFLKHRAWLWLKKYDKQKLPVPDAATQALFDAGSKLEAYAERLFPGGKRLGFDSYAEYVTLAQRTKQVLADGHTTLFQARFDADNLICLTDVVVFTSPDTVKLYEIKSSSGVRVEHEFDLAFQCTVLERCGYRVESISVVHLNTDYVRQGEIDCQQLLKTVDVTEAVRARLEATALHIEQAFKVMASPTIPDISPRHCRLNSLRDWLPIYRQLRELPELSIYDLTMPSAQLCAELEDAGISSLREIPDLPSLSTKQKRHIQAMREGAAIINKHEISRFLSGLSFPLYFFDYETCADIIPPYDGVKPNQQVPVQYSLHILEAPGEELRHVEYIHRTPDHPGTSLAEALKGHVGSTGSLIVWYAPFETGRNRELADLLPEYADFFQDINDRTVDLMQPFSDGHYLHPDFMGSCSIKKVLPVLVPELSYKELDVQEGLTAQRIWMQQVLGTKPGIQPDDRQLKKLLAYCELDTLAMVKIYDHLVDICK